MPTTQSTADQPYVLLRHRDCLPCVIAKQELMARKRVNDRLFIRRAIILILVFFGSIPMGLWGVRFAEERGYFEWASEVDLRPIAFVISGLLLAGFVWLVIEIEKQKRRDSNPPCPNCSKPLIGANLWPPVKIAAGALLERRKARMKKLLLHTSSKYVLAPAFIVMLLSFPVALLIMQNLRPDLDPNGWSFFLRAFPMVIIIYLVSGYLLTLLHVRRAIQRKGRGRALEFLFPEAFNGRDRWQDRISYRALGLSDMTKQKVTQ